MKAFDPVTIRANSAKEALSRIRRELGVDVTILSHRKIADEHGRTVVEVTAVKKEQGKSAAKVDRPSIAVLPFLDLERSFRTSAGGYLSNPGGNCTRNR